MDPLLEGRVRLNLEAHERRLAEMREAWRAYYGEGCFGGVGSPYAWWDLPVEQLVRMAKGERPDDPNAVGMGTGAGVSANIELNFARLIVNKGASFLFGREVGFDIDAAAEGRSAAEAWLDGMWRRNRKMALLQRLAINGAVTGHAAVKIVVSGQWSVASGLRPARTTDDRPPATVALRVVNPAMLTVFFNPDDIEEVEEYRLEWNYLASPDDGRWTMDDGGRGGSRTARTSAIRNPSSVVHRPSSVYRRQRHVNEGRLWTIVDEQASEALGPWSTMQRVAWPFPFSAIVDCQNLPNPNEYYGSPDLEPDILRVINRLNFIVSDWNKALRLHAHPREWGTGFSLEGSGGAIKAGTDEMLVVPNPEAKLGLLEMQSDMQSTSMLYEKVKEALHEIARVPEVSVGKVDNVGTLSGVALEILYQPLMELTAVKQMTYGPLLEEVNRRALWIGGQGRDVEVRNQWPALLPSDPKLEREVANMDLNVLKIASRETIAGELGRDWQQERLRLGELRTAKSYEPQ